MAPPLFAVEPGSLTGRLSRLVVPVLVGVLLGLLVGFGVHRSNPATWTAQVAVELTGVRDRMDLNPTGTRGNLVSVDTDAQLVRSDAVVLAVALAQQRPEATVRSALEVSARPLSRIMLLSYTARSPEAAQDGAVLAARTMLQERDRLYLAPQRSYLDDVVRTTDPIDPELDLETVSGDVPARESLRRQAYAEQIGLQEAGRLVGEHGLTAVADRGDVEVPLTSGAASGALLAVLLVAALPQRGTASPPPKPGRPVRTWAGTEAGRRRRRRRRGTRAAVVLVLVLAGGVLSVPAALAMPRSYLGEARVYLPPQGGTAFVSRTNAVAQRVDFGTEAELVRSDEVLSRVVDRPDVDLTVDQLRERTQSSASSRGEVVEITFRAVSAGTAETVTSHLAEELVAARERRVQAWQEDRSQVVEASVTDAEADLAAALGPDGSRELVNALNRRIALLREDTQAALLSRVVDGGEVLAVSVAGDPGDRYQALVVAVAGPVTGLMLAVGGLAVVRRRRSRRGDG